MKFCMTHWGALKAEIDKRGLSHRISPTDKAAFKRVVSEIDGAAEPSTYDPLMDATNMIYAAALKAGGLYLMSDDYCPLCELEKHGGIPTEWIEGACGAAEQYCKEHNLQG